MLCLQLMNYLPSAEKMMSLEGRGLGIKHIFITQRFHTIRVLRGIHGCGYGDLTPRANMTKPHPALCLPRHVSFSGPEEDTTRPMWLQVSLTH